MKCYESACCLISERYLLLTHCQPRKLRSTSVPFWPCAPRSTLRPSPPRRTPRRPDAYTPSAAAQTHAAQRPTLHWPASAAPGSAAGACRSRGRTRRETGASPLRRPLCCCCCCRMVRTQCLVRRMLRAWSLVASPCLLLRSLTSGKKDEEERVPSFASPPQALLCLTRRHSLQAEFLVGRTIQACTFALHTCTHSASWFIKEA